MKKLNIIYKGQPLSFFVSQYFEEGHERYQVELGEEIFVVVQVQIVTNHGNAIWVQSPKTREEKDQPHDMVQLMGEAIEELINH